MTKSEKDFNADVGKRIQDRREELGMKQEELGGIFEFDRSHISKLEAGERTISLEKLKKIAQKLNTSADYLLGLTECKTPEMDYRAFCNSTGLDDISTKILEDINFLYGGKYLIQTINFLIKQEKLPPNEAFFEEKYRQIESSTISKKEKDKYTRKVKNIYDRMYQRWKDKNCCPILSNIEDYYTSKIEKEELHITNNSIKKEQDFTNELDKMETKKIITSEKIIENVYLEEIKADLKKSKQKFLEEGADKK